MAAGRLNHCCIGWWCVSGVVGVKSVAVDGEAGTLTVVGEVDVVRVATALRKARFEPRVLSVGPEKQPDKNDPPKKPDDAAKKPTADGEEAKEPPPPCCAGCSACRPLVPVPAHAHPFPGAVVCYEEQAPGNGCVIL